MQIRKLYCGQTKVPVLKPPSLSEREELLVFRFKARIINGCRYEVQESIEADIVQLNTPGKIKVKVEAGQSVAGRTDDHGRELHVSDGQSFNGCGYGTAVPGGQIPDNQYEGSRETCHHHKHPE